MGRNGKSMSIAELPSLHLCQLSQIIRDSPLRVTKSCLRPQALKIKFQYNSSNFQKFMGNVAEEKGLALQQLFPHKS